MQNTPDAEVPAEPCPICGGSGELIVIDEEVGCQVAAPCWACRREVPAPRSELSE
ncbi:MAG TPA: hypothetical protein VD865_09360 [Stenotrophomonas sp.]|nr:hypothetical protein [Stenotrophomonas sp.]